MKDRRPSDLLLLVVETPSGSKEEQLALSATVREVLGLDASGRPWRVERLFKGAGRVGGRAVASRDPLARFFRVSGHIDAPPQHFDKAAFEISYKLRGRSGLPVRPDLPSTSYGLPEDPEAQPPPSGDVVFESAIFPADDPLPESIAHDWPLQVIGAPAAWGLQPPQGGKTKGEGTLIAHPDTGWTDHPDMGTASYDLSKDRDVLADDNEARDPLDRIPGIPIYQPGHGTSTSSTLAGRLVTSVQGTAPLATVVPIRTMRSVIHIFDTDVARAVQHARSIKAHVISMSLGGVGFIGLSEVIEAAVREGIIVLAAAGNYVRRVTAPASYASCIAVAAINAAGQPWRYSCRGAKVAVSAPGQDVWVPGYNFGSGTAQADLLQHSGTSFAVTFAAGVAALWLAYHGRTALLARYQPENLQAAFLYVLTDHGVNRPADWDSSNMGAGIVDAERVLAAPLPTLLEVRQRQAVLRLEEAAQLEAVTEEGPLAGAGDELALLFPNLSRAELWRGLAATFGAGGNTLRELVGFYEPELVWIMSQRSAAWDAFVAAATAPADRSGVPLEGAKSVSPAGSLLGQYASPALARQVR